MILGGEPIVEKEYDAVPYPWGVRLHSEVVAVVRQQHWFELGFSEDFLYWLFATPDSRAAASTASRRCSAGCTFSSGPKRIRSLDRRRASKSSVFRGPDVWPESSATPTKAAGSHR